MTSNFILTPQPGDDVPDQKKYGVDLSLQGFVGNMSDRATSIADSIANQQGGDLHPEIADHLKKVADLSQQLQAELDLIKQIDPDTFAKLKQA